MARIPSGQTQRIKKPQRASGREPCIMCARSSFEGLIYAPHPPDEHGREGVRPTGRAKSFHTAAMRERKSRLRPGTAREKRNTEPLPSADGTARSGHRQRHDNEYCFSA